MLAWVENKVFHAKAQKWRRLDLGNAGLTEVPTGLLDLVHLEILILGKWYYHPQTGEWRETENTASRNRITQLPSAFSRLASLTQLYLNNNPLVNADSLAQLENLTALSLSFTRVSSVEPLAMLKTLTSLFLSGTPIASAEPLAALRQLTALSLSRTGIISWCT
jgi:Leucine-rich repeat (LRR) protein